MKNIKIKAIFKNVSIFVLAFGIIATSQASFAMSSSGGLSQESVDFLEQHNVSDETISIMNSNWDFKSLDSSIVTESYDDMIKSLIPQVDAYDFNDQQIQAYVDGLIETPTKIIKTDDSPMLNSTPYSTNRPWDQGIGYEVKTESGYYQETAFVTLPTVYRNTATSTYLFYTFSNPSGSTALDIGLWYTDGYYGEGWRDVYFNGTTQETVNDLLGLSAGDEVYLQAYVTDNYYVRCRILDADNFSNVISDFSIWVGSGMSRSTAIIDRQITMCNENTNFNTGEYMHDAEFNDAYIYTINNTYSKTLPSNTEDDYCGVFGTNDINKLQVSVNNYEEWWMENIDIDF